GKWDIAYDMVQANPQPQEPISGPEPEEDDWDQAYSTVVGKVEPRDRGTFVQRMKGASARGWMQLGESVLRLPALVVGQAKLATQYAQAERIHAAKDPFEQKQLRQGLNKLEKGYDSFIDELSQSAEWHKQGQEKIIENHPEWESEPPENIKDLILSPDKLSIALAESLPVLVSAGILTAAGQPHVATALMFATESNQAFTEAKRNGESDDTARDAALVYGLVAAAIEQMQLGHIMKIGKGAYKAILNRTVQKVSKQGVKSITKAIIITSAKEAAEEMVQGTWGEITAKTIYDKPMLEGGGVKGFVDRRAQEAYIGFMMGVIPGVGGAAAGGVARRVSGGPSAGVTMEVPDTPRRPVGKDSSPEELARDITILEKGHMTHFVSKLSSMSPAMANVLDAATNKKATRRQKAAAVRNGSVVIANSIQNIRGQVASVSGHIQANPNTFIEGNKLLDVLTEAVALGDSFLEQPSRKTLNKLNRILPQVDKLVRSHMGYFTDLVETLRKHPGYENLSVAPKDAQGTGHPIAPITSTVPGETITDIARRGDKKALEEA
ncbi:hypothetical protein LCGC14_2359760, partial [marine sediment metagenome]